MLVARQMLVKGVSVGCNLNPHVIFIHINALMAEGKVAEKLRRKSLREGGGVWVLRLPGRLPLLSDNLQLTYSLGHLQILMPLANRERTIPYERWS